jgi:large subunit ribosomal protein L6
MSRIGNRPIELGDDVSAEIAGDNAITLKGPHGELSRQVDEHLTVEQQNGALVVTRESDTKQARAQHGLYRALISNMVKGVAEGYTKELEIRGIGYRANMRNGALHLELGFSHPIFFVPPDGIDVSAEEGGRGDNPRVTVEGADKQLVGQVAAKIRELRPPEPYKGKGIRYVGEDVERKAGKTGVTATTE